MYVRRYEAELQRSSMTTELIQLTNDAKPVVADKQIKIKVAPRAGRRTSARYREESRTSQCHMMAHNVLFKHKCVTAFVSPHEIQTKQGLTTYAASPIFYEVSVSADERI